ncbi:hypothetical protein [Nocardioides nanhaiensis]
MTGEQGLARRTTRLENDVEAIYDLLTDVRTALDVHTARLDAIDTTLDSHTATLDAHTATLDAHTATLDAHTARFDTIDTTLAEVLRRLPDPS